MRNISFNETKAQFRARTKRVTRRLGWATLGPGQHLQAIEKGQGLKKGEQVVRLGEIKIISVRRERVDAITQADVILEGFPGWTTAEFIAFFCKLNGCQPDTLITRIEFEYV